MSGTTGPLFTGTLGVRWMRVVGGRRGGFGNAPLQEAPEAEVPEDSSDRAQRDEYDVRRNILGVSEDFAQI